MTTDFPAGLDAYQRPTATQMLGDTPKHSDTHDNAYDAIEALQTKVGIDGSAVTTSFDYFLKTAGDYGDVRTSARPWYDVTHSDYGAVGDGVTDDAPAIQAAIDAAATAGGGVVFLPEADYAITAALRLKDFVELRGVGRTATKLTLKNSSNTSMIVIDSVNVERVGVRDMWLFGNKSNQAAGSHHGIFIDNTGGGSFAFNDSMPILSDLLISSCKGDGVRLTADCRDPHLRNVQVRTCDGVGFNLSCTDGGIFGCTAGNSGLEGFLIAGANNRLFGCKSFQNGQITSTNGDGFRFTAQRCVAVACESQDNQQHGFNLDGCDRGNFGDMFADANGQGVTGYGFRVNDATDIILTGVAQDRQGVAEQSHALRFDGTQDRGYIMLVGRNNVNAGISGTVPTGMVVMFSDNTNGVALKLRHVAAATPSGGYSGEIRVGTGKFWVNDGGTWRSLGIGNGGASTQSGDGTTQAFTIAHGLAATPAVVHVTANSEDAHGDFYATADGTNITVTYHTAPISGTNNLKWSWRGEL